MTEQTPVSLGNGLDQIQSLAHIAEFLSGTHGLPPSCDEKRSQTRIKILFFEMLSMDMGSMQASTIYKELNAKR